MTRQPDNILRDPGTRKEDGVKGGHTDVLVQGDEAYVFYFTHPRRAPGAMVCDRNAEFPFSLKPGVDNWSRQ